MRESVNNPRRTLSPLSFLGEGKSHAVGSTRSVVGSRFNFRRSHGLDSSRSIVVGFGLKPTTKRR